MDWITVLTVLYVVLFWSFIAHLGWPYWFASPFRFIGEWFVERKEASNQKSG